MAAHYRSSLASFLLETPNAIVGALVTGLTGDGGHDATKLVIDAWVREVEDLQIALRDVAMIVGSDGWTVLLEYRFPVVGRRIDCVLIVGDLIFVVEYKGGTTTSGASALTQAQGYAQDLQDFHAESRGRTIVPIAMGRFAQLRGLHKDAPLFGAVVVPNQLASTLIEALRFWRGDGEIDAMSWDRARYFPVPSIIEAATAAYNDQRVADIAKARCEAQNLTATQAAIVDTILEARANSRKVLVIVTGVPGAGKTLAGLNAVQSITPALDAEAEHAAYLSGNGPLVKVLQEAIRASLSGKRGVKSAVEARIREVHRFIRDSFQDARAPAAKVIVFDEAQRAWSAAKNNKKFALNVSEPEMMLDIMARHPWAVVVALVGGGQEIGSGEAGLVAWGDALARRPEWHVVSSPEAITGGTSVADSFLVREGNRSSLLQRIKQDDRLHLGIPVRSIDSDTTAEWVNAVLAGDVIGAQRAAGSSLPIWITRDLSHARRWLRDSARGGRRCGLVASSGALRLRADGVEPPTFSFLNGLEYWRWFLAPESDHRSSFQLEIAMSEFEMQGLELDFVGLLWGGDLILIERRLTPRRLSGTEWEIIGASERADGADDLRRRVINKYRVLMTRFRKSMVIFVPIGSKDDNTRSPNEFDELFDYLVACGVRPAGPA